MTNLFKPLIQPAMLGLLAVGFLSGITAPTVTAQSLVPYAYKVTTPKGLNLRDANCKAIKTLAYGTLLTSTMKEGTQGVPTEPMSKCEVGGRNYSMLPVNYTYAGSQFVEGFVAVDWVDEVLGDMVPAFEAGKYLYVDATLGLNTRDKSCKKISALAHQAEVNAALYTNVNEVFCAVNGVTYAMTPVSIRQPGQTETKQVYIATAFVQAHNAETITRRDTMGCPEYYTYSVKNNICKAYFGPETRTMTNRPDTVPAIRKN